MSYRIDCEVHHWHCIIVYVCLDLVEDRLHVVSSEVLQKQNTPTSCAAEADAEAQNYVDYHQDCMQTQDCAGL